MLRYLFSTILVSIISFSSYAQNDVSLEYAYQPLDPAAQTFALRLLYKAGPVDFLMGFGFYTGDGGSSSDGFEVRKNKNTNGIGIALGVVKFFNEGRKGLFVNQSNELTIRRVKPSNFQLFGSNSYSVTYYLPTIEVGYKLRGNRFFVAPKTSFGYPIKLSCDSNNCIDSKAVISVGIGIGFSN